MTKLVNLDQLNVQTDRRIVWKEKTYQVQDFSVRDFITYQALQAQFGKAYSSDDIATVLKLAKEITALAVPDFDVEDLDSMNPIQLLSIQALISNLWPDEAAAEVTEGASDQGNVSPA
jgi:hypothetical protein